MTNGQNVARSRHLEELAQAAKRYTLREILDVTEAVAAELESIRGSAGATVLDTVPATVDGGLWYEVNNNVPTLKLHAGNYNYGFNYDLITYKDDNSHLAAYLPFNVSPTADAYGNEWATSGSPTIIDGALYLDGSSHLTLSSLTLGGQDFTMDACFYFVTISNCSRVPELYNANVDGYLKCYINGQLVSTTADANSALLQTRQEFPNIFVGANRRLQRAKAYVKHFRIFDGVALWTENFTPPTASDYS